MLKLSSESRLPETPVAAVEGGMHAPVCGADLRVIEQARIFLERVSRCNSRPLFCAGVHLMDAEAFEKHCRLGDAGLFIPRSSLAYIANGFRYQLAEAYGRQQFFSQDKVIQALCAACESREYYLIEEAAGQITPGILFRDPAAGKCAPVIGHARLIPAEELLWPADPMLALRKGLSVSAEGDFPCVITRQAKNTQVLLLSVDFLRAVGEMAEHSRTLAEELDKSTPAGRRPLNALAMAARVLLNSFSVKEPSELETYSRACTLLAANGDSHAGPGLQQIGFHVKLKSESFLVTAEKLEREGSAEYFIPKEVFLVKPRMVVPAGPAQAVPSAAEIPRAAPPRPKDSAVKAASAAERTDVRFGLTHQEHNQAQRAFNEWIVDGLRIEEFRALQAMLLKSEKGLFLPYDALGLASGSFSRFRGIERSEAERQILSLTDGNEYCLERHGRVREFGYLLPGAIQKMPWLTRGLDPDSLQNAWARLRTDDPRFLHLETLSVYGRPGFVGRDICCADIVRKRRRYAVSEHALERFLERYPMNRPGVYLFSRAHGLRVMHDLFQQVERVEPRVRPAILRRNLNTGTEHYGAAGMTFVVVDAGGTEQMIKTCYEEQDFRAKIPSSRAS